MIIPLQLRHDPTLNAPPVAWFLPGNSAARWLEELARCGLAIMETRLFAVPRCVQDRTAAGVLIVPSRPETVTQPPAGMTCRLIANKLFIPIGGELFPPVADSELALLSPLPTLFYHPAFGLSGFETESVLRVSDLLALPQEQSANWNFARPGSASLPQLASIVLLQPSSIEDIFGGADNDIGSEPLIDLPEAPDEPKDNPLGKSGRMLQRMFAKSVSETIKHVPHTGTRRTWLNELEDWANKHLHAISGDLDRIRNKELHRLLHLLDKDPEAGLRHAIPLNNFAHRGIAPPSARLGPRPLNFDPNRIGGNAADFWNVPPGLQETLRRRYREMADREMQLGRHRRAAYIYAELLGDLVSAANTLKQGRLFREAALLYEEHLKNPLKAAECLADGGFLDEAIERFEKLGRWLNVADLHERAGNRAAAEQALRRVVNERLAGKDILTAANLVEKRLHQPDEAVQLLLGAWPKSHQAANCLGAAFQILARLGRHETTLEQLGHIKRETVSDSMTLPLLSTLRPLAHNYPHATVRHTAADFSRVLIARQLQRPAVASEQVAPLLDHLVRLAPQDRVLSRDANRYLAERRASERRVRRIAPGPAKGTTPVVHHRFELPRQIRWVALRGDMHWFFALGVTQKRLTLLRGIWPGEFQSVSWECVDKPLSAFVVEPTAEQGRGVAVGRSDHAVFEQKRFPASDQSFDRPCVAGTPSWLPRSAFPFAVGEDTAWSLDNASGRLILSCFNNTDGDLLRTLDISADLVSDAEISKETRLSIAAVESTVFVAAGNRLLCTRADGGMTRVDLPGQVIKLVATTPNTRRGVAVMMTHGAVMYWVGASECIELDRDIPAPIGTFVHGGPLVLVSASQMITFEVDSRGVHSVARMQIPGSQAVGVSATSNRGDFAMLDERGEIIVYRCP